jgi:hypothetical protein
MGVTGAATAHEALSDASDASYVSMQLTSLEPVKYWRGNLTDLPVGAGVVLGVVINVRASLPDAAPSPSVNLASGEYPTVRIATALTIDTTIDYATGSLNLGDPTAMNGLQYMAGCSWVAHTSNARIYRMNFDVDYNFVSGVTVAMIFQWLGPLVAVGLHEMPALSRELWRRSGIFLRPRELEAAWREMREDRRRLVLA